MIKRQWRLERIVRIAQEYLAADTAAELLAAELKADPNYGEARGWSARAGGDVVENLPATYVVRIYAEFEAGLRDYWQTHLGQANHPPMIQLVRHLIPNQRFSQDCIDNADEVRIFRNFLVHDFLDEPPADMVAFTVFEAKKHLCDYFARLDATWQ
ncbi:MAG TPA: hypothetical protein VNH11_26550 [Pirellulales bacterium]|nr:hypothetical protein [Pirellulales bacterium]